MLPHCPHCLGLLYCSRPVLEAYLACTCISIAVKGQLISECLFDFLNFPKKHRKIWQISAQDPKRGWNHQNKDNFHTIIIYIWLYGLFKVLKTFFFMIWPLFRSLGRNLSNFSVLFGKFEKSKRHSEIIWPLTKKQQIAL